MRRTTGTSTPVTDLYKYAEASPNPLLDNWVSNILVFLKLQGIQTVEQLCEKSVSDILKLPWDQYAKTNQIMVPWMTTSSDKVLTQIQATLALAGLHLREEPKA